MTTDQYISFTKTLLPIHPGRYNNLIEETFKGCHFFEKMNLDIDFRIISSASLFSEVVFTEPRISLIWDNYQYELIEKFYLAGITALNNKEDIAISVFKANLYAVLSIRMTEISPELSYIFAKYYREELNKFDYKNIYLIHDNSFDFLYCQLLSLGHELSHIIFDKAPGGKQAYEILEEDFDRLMEGTIKARGDECPYNGSKTYSEIIQSIQKKENSNYKKEIICDAYSFALMNKQIVLTEKTVNQNRGLEELYDDIIETYRFVLLTLDSLLYVLEFWTRIGIKSKYNKMILQEHLNSPSHNYTIWNSQFDAREMLTFLYVRVKFFEEKGIFIEQKNKKPIAVYNSISSMYNKFINCEDKEWLEICQETNQLYAMNINAEELLDNRDYFLFSNDQFS